METHQEINQVLNIIEELVGPGLQSTVNAARSDQISRELFNEYGKLYELCLQSQIPIDEVDFEGNTQAVCNSIIDIIRPLSIRASFEAGRRETARSLQENYVKLNTEEIEEIENHIKDARSKIRASKAFDDKHKNRLLQRLEKLQVEIHKKLSDKDVFLAAVTEVTAVAGQSAENLNPVVKLFRDIFKITDGRSDSPLQLPSPPKQIEDKSGDE